VVSQGYVPEIVLAPVLAVLIAVRPRTLVRFVRTYFTLRLTLFIFAGAAISALVGLVAVSPAKETYTHFRTIIAFTVSYLYFSRFSKLSSRSCLDVMLVVLASYIIYLNLFGSTRVAEAMAEKNRFPILLGIAGLILCIRIGSPIRGLLIVISAGYLAAASNYRIYVGLFIIWATVFVVSSLFSTGRMRVVRSKIRRAINLVSAVVIGILLLFNSPALEFIGTSLSDETTYSQLVIKTELAWSFISGSSGVSGEASLDDRLYMLGIIMNNAIMLLTPIGLGTGDAIQLIDTRRLLSTMDSGVGFLAVHFGVIIGLAIIIAAVREYRFLYFNKRWLDYLFGATLIVYFLTSLEVLAIFEMAVSSGMALGVYKAKLGALSSQPDGAH
jgi:hypothetical protein